MFPVVTHFVPHFWNPMPFPILKFNFHPWFPSSGKFFQVLDNKTECHSLSDTYSDQLLRFKGCPLGSQPLDESERGE